MIIPVRCYTCGKVMGDKWNIYQKKINEGKNHEEIFRELKVNRYCCKIILKSHVNLIDKILEYEDSE